MIRISKLADYAVVILSKMAEYSDELMNSALIAELSRLPEPTVSKLLKLLSKADVIESVRGAHGGYRLKALPNQISIEQIVSAIDGPIAITACTDGAQPDCSLSEACSLRGRWDGVNAAIRSALDTVTLADMRH